MIINIDATNEEQYFSSFIKKKIVKKIILRPFRQHLAPWFPWNLEMRKLSNWNKKNLLDNPGKILISNFRSNLQTQTWKLSIMSAISFLPLNLARSAGVCKGYQNEWQKHSLIWALKCLIQTPKRNPLLLSLRLSHIKRIIPLFLSDLFSPHHYDLSNKGWVKRFHTWSLKDKWEERRDEEKKGKKTITNGNQNAKYTTQKSTFFYEENSHQIKKNAPKKIVKSNILFVILSFLELILLLTHCQWHNVLCQISQSPSQYPWWFHTFFNDLSAPYCRSISTHSLHP